MGYKRYDVTWEMGQMDGEVNHGEPSITPAIWMKHLGQVQVVIHSQ